MSAGPSTKPSAFLRPRSSVVAAPPSWTPHKYQERALKFLLERLNAALFLDPGLGKTSIVLAAVRILKNRGLHEGTLVVAPRRPAVMVWRQEAAAWAEFADLDVTLIHGPEARRVELLQTPHDVYVTTYETFLWLIRSGWLKKLRRARLIRNVVFDELSKMKNTQTVRFKTIKKDLAKFDRRWGLTGSPAANGLMDLFGECFALDLGRSLGKFITHYRVQYFDAYGDEQHPSWAPRPGAEEAIYARIANLALRIDGEEHLQLPKLITNRIAIELPPDVREKYEEFEQEFVVQLESETFTADTAAALSMKCRQLASGALYEDRVDPETGIPRAGKRRYTILHDEKLEALEELIDELQGQQLLVAYYFGHDLERINKHFGPLPSIGGGTTDKRALELQDAWNAGDVRVLLGHPSSIGHGLNMQKSSAHHLAIFSPTWSFEEYDQFIRRLRRQGNKSAHVMLHQLAARDTVDDALYIAMKRKGSVQQRLHDALRDYRHTRKYTGLLA